MKKQVLIVFTGSLELGGIERSLIGLLDAIDYEKYNVDLMLYAHHGELYNSINPRVNVLPEIRELAYLREAMWKKLVNRCFYSALLRLNDALLRPFRQTDYDLTWAKVVHRAVPSIEKQYDYALGFFRPFDVIAEKVNARVKIGWVHTDYSQEMQKPEVLRRDYSRVDRIAAVSDACKSTFVKCLPEYSSKVFVAENILSADFVRRQASLSIGKNEMPFGRIKILSIGRFCYAKNFDSVPEICKLIREKGFDIHWYLIGFGSDESMIRMNIHKYGMGEHITILGRKNNPYPYIRNCDFYIQPSRYEGKCLAVREAQILNKPVIITNYHTSESQVENGVDGIIVPQDTHECAEEIIKVISDPALINKIVNNTKSRDYSCRNAINVIFSQQAAEL